MLSLVPAIEVLSHKPMMCIMWYSEKNAAIPHEQMMLPKRLSDLFESILQTLTAEIPFSENNILLTVSKDPVYHP